jgi:multiple sugar transport system substrate-binding protein
VDKIRKVRAVGAAILAAGLTAAALAGCSSGSGSGSSSSAGGTYTFWDPYPQYTNSSAWAKVIDKCGTESHVTIKRTAYDTSDLTNKALLAGQQQNSPNILLVDNPVVSTLASAGILTTTSDNGLSTKGIAQNILGAGVIDGKTYGVPIGANTLALYYNPKVLQAAGVDIASVTDWNSLTAALQKVVASGHKGITFSGIGTEEGSFQFLPWLWGSGANLKKLDSSDAQSALTLWTDWVKQGLAPNSVINNTQTTSWQEFQTGDFGFAENGTWQKASAAQAGDKVVPLPGKTAGSPAPAPTGGEFFTIPTQKNTGTYKTSAAIVSCLTNSKNILNTVNTLNYIGANKTVQQEQLKADPSLKPWVDAVQTAKARTGDNLGTNYPIISQQMWGAVQNALSGSQSPADALMAAQTAAAAKVK